MCMRPRGVVLHSQALRGAGNLTESGRQYILLMSLHEKKLSPLGLRLGDPIYDPTPHNTV